MKRIRAILFLVACFQVSPVAAQTAEATQLILNYEKLRTLEEILDNMYKGYKIVSKGYETVKKISEGNYSLHDLFIDGLMVVNPNIRNYRRIPFIIDYQKLLVKEYKRAYNRFKKDRNFNVE